MKNYYTLFGYTEVVLKRFWKVDKTPNTIPSDCNPNNTRVYRTPNFVTKNIFGNISGDPDFDISAGNHVYLLLAQQDQEYLTTEEGDIFFLIDEFCA